MNSKFTKIQEARVKEHLNSIHIIFPRPEGGMCRWYFGEKRLEKLGLVGGQTCFYLPKARIIDRLLESQGMERNSLPHNRFKLLFSSASFHDYQLKLEKAELSDKWVSYDIIEAPQEVMRLSNHPPFWFRKASQYLIWDIRKYIVLAFFSSVPDFIFMKAEPLVDLEEIKDLISR